MKKENCIFCKIASGDIPSRCIYEDEALKAFLDVRPATKGHTLIMPKNHYQDIYELPEEIAAKLMTEAKRLTIRMTDRLHCDGFNLVQNNGELAGQTVPHFHLHLIPRYKEDGQTLGWQPMDMTPEELDRAAAIILE